jgi:class 3 adenylate cyclase
MMILSCAAIIFWKFFEFATSFEFLLANPLRFAWSVAVIVGCFAVVKVTRMEFFQRNVMEYTLIGMVFVIAGSQIQHIASGHNGILSTSVMLMIFCGGFRIRFIHAVGIAMYHNTLFFCRYLLFFGLIQKENRLSFAQSGAEMLAEYIILEIGVTVFSLHYAYALEKSIRMEFVMYDSLDNSKQRALAHLRGMFPDAVVDQVVDKFRQEDIRRNNVTAINSARGGVPDSQFAEMQPIYEDRGTVTVLFCDIHDFDSLTESLKPVELVTLLDRVFSMFDRICDRRRVVKIETVGKTYMSCAMSASPEETKIGPQHAADAISAVLMAIDMLELVKKSVLGCGNITKVAVQIGVNTGRVFSGVVGSKKPQYALFGDTVNTAARMCSNSKRNHLHISESTFDLVRHDERLFWEARQTYAKGKGILNTYLLTYYQADKQKFGSRKSNVTGKISNATTAEVLQSIDDSPATDVLESSPSKRPTAVGPHGSTTNGSVIQVSDLPHTASASNASTDMIAGTGTQTAVIQSADPSTLHGEGTETDTRGAGRPSAVLGGTLKDTDQKQDDKDKENIHRAMKNYSLEFRNHSLEKEFRASMQSDSQSLWVSFLSFWLCYLFSSLVIVVGHPGRNANDLKVVMIFRLGYSFIFLPISFLVYNLVHKKQKVEYFQCMSFLVFLGFLVSMLSNCIWLTQHFRFSYALEVFFFITILAHNCGLLFMRGAMLTSGCVLTTLSSVVFLWDPSARDLLVEIIVMLVICQILQLVAMYYVEERQRATFMLGRGIREEHEKANQLLDCMLPMEVLAELKTGNLSLAYSYENMSLLFADIVGFTSYASERPVFEVVSLVTRLFAEFDEATLEFGVYKVHTIGDAYIVVNQPKRRHSDIAGDAMRVFYMAERMIHVIIRVRDEVQHEKLDMRIGLHNGKFCAGVIGTKRLRFDIWGPDVLAGNLVESYGIPGAICASESAKRVLQKACPGKHEFQFKCNIPLKNKDIVKSYQVIPVDGRNYSLSNAEAVAAASSAQHPTEKADDDALEDEDGPEIMSTMSEDTLC